MAVCPGPDGCVQYLVSRAEMISAHSHSGSVRAGGAARAAGHHGRFTRHTATLTGDPPRDRTERRTSHSRRDLKTENRLCTFDSEI